MIHLRSSIGDTKGGQDHQKEMKHFKACSAHAEGKNIFISFNEMVIG